MAIDEDARPVDLVCINVDAFSIHKVVLPGALVSRSISIDHLAKALHDALLPLSGVDVAAGELVRAVSMHLVLIPVAIVLFNTDRLATGSSGTCENDFSFSMLDFDLERWHTLAFLRLLEDLPLADVQSLIDILELSET